MRVPIKDGYYRGYKYYVIKITEMEGGIYSEWGDNRYWFCGYVVIPDDHKIYKEDDWNLLDDEYEVHGGITYTGWHRENQDEWVIGFDCNHAMDNPEIENAEYTENECKNLINQLAINTNKYYYGMRLRGFSPGCQPERGLLGKSIGPFDNYHDVIAYDRELSEKELREYEMERINIIDLEQENDRENDSERI